MPSPHTHSARDGRKLPSYYKGGSSEPHHHHSHSRHYASTSSRQTDRYTADKKPYSSLPSSFHSQSTPLSHRYYYSGNSGRSSHDHATRAGYSSSSRVEPHRRSSGKPHFEQSSGRTRRVAPPPPLPLMKAPSTSTSTSRYRQAPPEDHHPSRYSSSSHEPRKDKDRLSRNLEPKGGDSKKVRKRTADKVVSAAAPDTKRQKDDPDPESRNIVEEEIDGDEDEQQEKKNDNDVLPGEKEKAELATSYNKALLKLYCPYCDTRCLTLREFVYHLRGYSHIREMSNVVGSMKKKLGNLRLQQRDQQKELEKSEDGQKDLSDTISYCRVCELNFRTDPKEHEKQELHNELKALVDRTCEVCNIQFRFWKVYLYHVVALEHVKRVAILELNDKDSSFKGTNLSEEELGLDLMEQRTVLYCKACVRYVPIRESEDETKIRHCMSVSHIKLVDEHREKQRRAVRRQELISEEPAKKTTTAEDVAVAAVEGVDASEKAEFLNPDNRLVENMKEEEDEDEIQLHAEEDETVGVSSNKQ